MRTSIALVDAQAARSERSAGRATPTHRRVFGQAGELKFIRFTYTLVWGGGIMQLRRENAPSVLAVKREATFPPNRAAVTPTFSPACLAVGKPALRSCTGSWPRCASNVGGRGSPMNLRADNPPLTPPGGGTSVNEHVVGSPPRNSGGSARPGSRAGSKWRRMGNRPLGICRALLSGLNEE